MIKFLSQIQSAYQSNILSKTIEFKDGDSLANTTTEGPNYWKTKYHFLKPDPVAPNQKNGVSKSNGHSSLSKPEDESKSVTKLHEDSNIKPKFRIDSGESITLEWKRINKIGAGLLNLGNTCFMNSVLQCLTYCPPLMNHLVIANEHIPNCRLGFCMACELAKHAKRAYESSGGVVKPLLIAQRLKAVAKHFCLGRQEDAHEYLRYLIDHMSKSYVNIFEQKHQNIKLDVQSKQTTLIHEIFGGYHRSRVQCLECNSNSDTFDYFMDFMMDIKNASSLEKALEKYIQPEILQQDNAYKCPKCKKKVPARKQFTVYRAPRVATFQLKRFDFSRMFGGKINKPVQYPETLNLRPYMSTKNGPPVLYKLFGVLVHLGGSCNSGHYYCYVRNTNGYWYQMDDARVSSASLNVVLNQSAYILFYVRKSDPNSLVSPKPNGNLPKKPNVNPNQNSSSNGFTSKNGPIFKKSESNDSVLTTNDSNLKKSEPKSSFTTNQTSSLKSEPNNSVLTKKNSSLKKSEPSDSFKIERKFSEIDIFSRSNEPNPSIDKNSSLKTETSVFKSPAPPLPCSPQKKIQTESDEISKSSVSSEKPPVNSFGLFNKWNSPSNVEFGSTNGKLSSATNGTSANRISMPQSTLESLGDKGESERVLLKDLIYSTSANMERRKQLNRRNDKARKTSCIGAKRR